MSTKKITDTEGLIVNTKVLASILDVSDRRVRQLAEEGVIDKVKTGTYELVPTIRKYILYLKIKNDNSADEMTNENTYMAEKTLHEKAKRQIAELELAQMQGKLHDSRDVEREMTKMLAAFRARILSIPSKLAPRMIAQNEISVIEDALQNEVYSALQELADYDPELFKNDKYVGELDDEEEESTI